MFWQRLSDSLHVGIAAFWREWHLNQAIAGAADLVGQQMPPQGIPAPYLDIDMDKIQMSQADLAAAVAVQDAMNVQTLAAHVDNVVPGQHYQHKTDIALSDGSTITIDLHQAKAAIPEASVPYYAQTCVESKQRSCRRVGPALTPEQLIRQRLAAHGIMSGD